MPQIYNLQPKYSWLDEFRIDSLKVILPIDTVKILNPNIGKTIMPVYEDSGEIAIDEKDFKKNSQRIYWKGITIHYSITGNYNGKSNQFVLLLNSKILGSRYFEGITEDNIKLVYEKLMMLNEFYFDYDTFIKDSRCTDIDFKKDSFVPDLKKRLKDIKGAALSYRERNKGMNIFNGKNKGLGVEFGIREKATEAYPYMKIYHKGMELGTNSLDFYNEFIAELGYDTNNIVRNEFTMKDLKMMRRYGIFKNSLHDILSIGKDKLETIQSEVCSVHMSTDNLKRHNIDIDKNLKPNDIWICSYMVDYLSEDKSIGMFKDKAKDLFRGKKNAKREIDKVDDLYKRYIIGGDLEDAGTDTEAFWSFIGLYKPNPKTEGLGVA